MTWDDQLTTGIDDTPDTAPSTESKPVIFEDNTKDMFLNMEPLKHIADGKRVRVPKSPSFTRKDVVNAFQEAFELIGGVPRLALWANENQTEFYKLYSKLLPSQSTPSVGENNTMRIEIGVRPSPLDVLPDHVPRADHDVVSVQYPAEAEEDNDDE